MPSTALKHLAKKADVSTRRAEHLWHKAEDIVEKEYGRKHKGFYALVMGITKKMLRLGEDIDYAQIYNQQDAAMNPETNGAMAALIGNLLKARDTAHMWHWKVKSFSMHMALGELYEELLELVDELFEMYMGEYGTDAHVPLSEPNAFSEQDPTEFVRQLHDFLRVMESKIPQNGFLVNKYQELQGVVARVKYKMENLK
jgi:DNA-binding ferritin-like protein